MKIRAYPKINLCVDILKKDQTGYHEIRTVLHELKSPFDTLEIFKTKEEDNMSIANLPEFSYPNPPPSNIHRNSAQHNPAGNLLTNLPINLPIKSNLAFKALKLMKSRYKISDNFHVRLIKRIPIASGLGGASADAAAVLKALNQLLSLELSTETLRNLAAELGCDVPFFITGKTALATHYGEKITPLPHIKNLEFKILPLEKWPAPKNAPAPHSKTAFMYQSLDLKKCGKKTDKTDKLIAAIKKSSQEHSVQSTQPTATTQILENLHNDFETLYPKLSPNTHLSGSGPAIFHLSD